MQFYFKGTEIKEIMFQSKNMSTEPLPTHVAIQEKPNECRFYVDILYIKSYGIILPRVYFIRLSAVTRNNI